jgi:hypothetical protein
MLHAGDKHDKFGESSSVFTAIAVNAWLSAVLLRLWDLSLCDCILNDSIRSSKYMGR